MLFLTDILMHKSFTHLYPPLPNPLNTNYCANWLGDTMTIIGIQFDKILLEKFGPAKGKVSVNNNVVVKEVSNVEITFGNSKQDVLKFDFEFKATYDPKIAELTFTGSLTYFDKKEKVAELAASWKKDKKISKEVMSPILNSILSKCNIEALVLSREVNLPPPIPMPKVNLK